MMVSSRTRRALSNGLFDCSDRLQLVLIKLENRQKSVKSLLVVISEILQSFLVESRKMLILTKFENSSAKVEKLNIFQRKIRKILVLGNS